MNDIESPPGFTVETLSRPRPRKGHDVYALGPTGAAVVDGATPLGGDYPQDLVQFVAAAAIELADGPFNDMEDLHVRTVRTLRERFPPAGYRRTAATATVRLNHGTLHCAVLGDCRVLIGASDRIIDVFDPTLTRLERKGPAAGPERRAESVRRRTQVFKQNLYQILGDVPTAAIPAVTAVIPVDEVDTIVLMSDGAWNVLPQEPELMLEALTGGQLDCLFDAARTAELSDDTTIIRMERNTD